MAQVLAPRFAFTPKGRGSLPDFDYDPAGFAEGKVNISVNEERGQYHFEIAGLDESKAFLPDYERVVPQTPYSSRQREWPTPLSAGQTGYPPRRHHMSRPPLPPFTDATAAEKARLAEDGWNSRDPARVALAYTPDSQWRNRAEFISGRAEIEAFLTRKWTRELEYRLIKEVWAHSGNRIAVRFAYEYRDDSGNWFRAYGNENWEFDADGLMARRLANINEHPITEADRKFRWPLGRRPDDHPGLSHFGF